MRQKIVLRANEIIVILYEIVLRDQLINDGFILH